MRGGGTCSERAELAGLAALAELGEASQRVGVASQRAGGAASEAGWAETPESCAGGRCAIKRPAEKKPSARIEPQNILRRLMGKTSERNHTEPGRSQAITISGYEKENGKGCFALPAIACGIGEPLCYFEIWSSARFSSRTFTRGSPKRPSCRCVVFWPMSSRTLSSVIPRALATRGAW